MRHAKRKIVVFVIVGLFTWWILNDVPPVSTTVDQLKQPSSITATAHPADRRSIEDQIKEAAERFYEPAINARIDSVWKAIPGYNGLAIDVKQSIELAKKSDDHTTLKFIYKEIPPEVQLHDLPPHPIYRGNEHKPMIALMINVAWGTEHLIPMLDILDAERVKATFFLDGSWLKSHPEMGKEIVKRGHEIGNHAYHHPQMSRLTTDKMAQEILETEALIQQTLQTKSSFFAPPSGDYNDQVVKVAAEHGLYTVLWTADTVDWRPTMTPEMMIERIRPHIGNGTLVLMHPTDRTVVALPEIIRLVKEKDLQLGTVSDVISSKRLYVH